MKINIRRWTLMAVMLSASAALPATASAQSYDTDGYDDYYGNEGGFVGDSTDYGVEQIAAKMYVGDEAALVAPMAASDHSAWQGYPAENGHHYGSTGQGYGSQCDSGCESGRGIIGRAMTAGNSDVWFTAELLLWFPQARQTPPLLVGDANAANLNAIDAAVREDEPFSNGLTPGFRSDAGRYFADGAFGIGGRTWILGSDSETRAFSGDGTGPFVGIPFFQINDGDPTLGFGENAILVNGGPNAGTATVRSSLEIMAAELYARARLGESRYHRLELLGGYSHFDIEDNLDLNATINIIPPGDRTTFSDSFRTRNEFHGGQIGNEISLQRGRWTASSLTKVHLGSMTQRVSVAGNSATGPIPVLTLHDEGLFARGNVRGNRERETFAFAPEMNLKLGYQFRRNVNFHAGYSFIYWSDVALAGEQMDRNLFIDPANLSDEGPARFVDIKHSGYWVQGIDLGATIEF